VLLVLIKSVDYHLIMDGKAKMDMEPTEHMENADIEGGSEEEEDEEDEEDQGRLTPPPAQVSSHGRRLNP
jgi:hypothetical protein